MIVTRESEAAAEILGGRIAEVCGVANVAAARLCGFVAEAIESGAWEVSGIRSVVHWVTWKTGVSTVRARKIISIARRLGELPSVRAAFEAGELSEDQVAVVCRFGPAIHDVELAEFARNCTVPQLASVLRRYNFDVEADESPVEEEKRLTSFGNTDEGTWRLSAELPVDEGAVVERAIETAQRDLKAAGNSRVSWSDALVAVADSYLAGKRTGRAPLDRHLSLVHVSVDEDGRIGAHLANGAILSEGLRRLLTCDGKARPIFEIGGRPVSFGKDERIVPDEIRSLVHERDRCCREPGCGATINLECHHIIHYEDGGPTETHNLVELCPPSHRRHHLGLLGISGNADEPDGLVFSDARGRKLDATGRPSTPTEYVTTGNWTHPSDERLDTRWVHFNPPRSVA